jgi:hypothetical protein
MDVYVQSCSWQAEKQQEQAARSKEQQEASWLLAVSC